MKHFLFINCIIIILLKTGNVLSDNNIFNVNNIEISKEYSKNNVKLVDQAFKKAFDSLVNRLLLKNDYRRVSNIDLNQIKKLISYYQIINPENNQRNKNVRVNVFFDKERMHNFFYNRNILYSDIINTEVIFFPLLKKNDEYFVYSQNYFYENWKDDKFEDIIQYTLPVENIETMQKIEANKNNIFKLDISNFFNEHDTNDLVFASIEINSNTAEIILNTRIEGKQINKTFLIKNEKNLIKKDFYDEIIININDSIISIIKSQNLIDVRTPSFLNVEIKLNNKKNLIEFSNRLTKIDLIDKFYVQELSKDYALVKIKYLGKINKIINKLKNQDINLKMIKGQWQLNII
jgi:hypothetical protein